MGKAKKSTKKFASSGQLKKTIQARHKHQQKKKQIAKRNGKKGAPKPAAGADSDQSEDEDEEVTLAKKTKMTVDSFLRGDFMDQSDDEDEMGTQDDDEGRDESGDLDEPSDDNESFADVDEFDEEGKNHLQELAQLAENDPEFFKYLQENDKELLNFDPNAADQGASEDEDDGDVDMDPSSEEVPVLTKDDLRRWQKAILEHRSLRALRKLLVAFRAAAHMNEEDQVVAWRIDSSSVYNKLVTTALRYTPVVLDYHAPCKTLPNGKFKPPTQTRKFKTLQKMILSFFHNVIHLIAQLTEEETLRLALTQSAKLVPYVISSRKAVKTYLKTCLDQWSSGSDTIRIAAFLAIRKLAAVSDESILDTVLKATYLALIRSSKSTTVYSLPSINLMKNSASDVFCIDHATSYQHAFGYIRQLAILLRNSMKIKSKDSHKQVYNWQFVHCVDFWCTVLARTCDADAEAESGKESELKPLIYPLVQIGLGAIKFIPNARSNPFHLHIVRSLLSLSKHTHTYIPVAPYLTPILTSTLTPSSRPKASTLRPLDLEVQIRVPQQYVKTRVLSENLTEEAAYLLAEWFASPAVHGSIAFPDIVVPILVLLRKNLKAAKSGSGKEPGMVKQLVERVEESARWVEQRRKTVSFSPGRLADVKEWEKDMKANLEDTPLGKYLKVQRKAREKRRALLEKAREGREEILDD